LYHAVQVDPAHDKQQPCQNVHPQLTALYAWANTGLYQQVLKTHDY